jgi:hypothetical protein
MPQLVAGLLPALSSNWITKFINTQAVTGLGILVTPDLC